MYYVFACCFSPHQNINSVKAGTLICPLLYSALEVLNNYLLSKEMNECLKLLPQLTDCSLKKQHQHLTFCYLYKSFLPPSVGKSSNHCGQSCPSSASFPTSSIYKKLCQPFPQNQLFAMPTAFSPTLVLTEHEGTDQDGWERRGLDLGAAFGGYSTNAGLWNSSKDTHGVAAARP